MKIGLEKTNTYEEVIVETLLDSGATELFMNRKFMVEQGFKMKKLAIPVKIWNINRSKNIRRTVTHEVEVNIYFKEYIE